MLPTLEKMNDQYPDLSKDQLCLKCNSNMKSSIYVFTCQDQLKQLQTSIPDVLNEILQQYTSNKHVTEIIKKYIKKSNLLKIDSSRINSFKTMSQSFFSIIDTLHFLIPISLTNTISRELKKTKQQIVPIIQKFTD